MKKERTSHLDEFLRAPRKALWTLGIPMMLGFTVSTLYFIVDMIFIGRLGPTALAAATFVGALYFLATAFGIGLATGITAVVAQAIGRRDRESADVAASNGLGIGLIIGIVFGATGLLFGRSVMPLLGAEGETAVLAFQYFELLCIGMPVFFYNMALRAVLTGEGDAKTPMIILAVATAVNVILDPICIFTLGMGIRGASVATLVAISLSAGAMSYVTLVRRGSFVRIRVSRFWPRRSISWPIISIGIPVAVGQIAMSAGIMLINRVLASYGQTAVAGYGAASRVDFIVAMPTLALAGAAVSIIGMFAGAGRADLVRSTALYTYKWVLILVGTVGTLSLIGADTVLGWFTSDASAIAVGKGYFVYMVVGYPLMAFGITSGRILQGVGLGTPTLVINAVRVIGIWVPGAYLAVYLLKADIHWVWIAGILGGVASNLLGFMWVREHLWKRDPTLLVREGVRAVVP